MKKPLTNLQSELKTVLNGRTRIELGFMVAVMTALSSGLWVVVKAFAEIEEHGKSISVLQTKQEKVDQLANDVSYLKGRFDAEFPPRK